MPATWQDHAPPVPATAGGRSLRHRRGILSQRPGKLGAPAVPGPVELKREGLLAGAGGLGLGYFFYDTAEQVRDLIDAGW
jgi:hypothetical protein